MALDASLTNKYVLCAPKPHHLSEVRPGTILYHSAWEVVTDLGYSKKHRFRAVEAPNLSPKSFLAQGLE